MLSPFSVFGRRCHHWTVGKEIVRFCFVLSEPATMVGSFKTVVREQCFDSPPNLRGTCKGRRKTLATTAITTHPGIVPQMSARPPRQWNIRWENHREGSVRQGLLLLVHFCAPRLLPLCAHRPTSFRDSISGCGTCPNVRLQWQWSSAHPRRVQFQVGVGAGREIPVGFFSPPSLSVRPCVCACFLSW